MTSSYLSDSHTKYPGGIEATTAEQQAEQLERDHAERRKTEVQLERLRRLAPTSLEAHARYVHRDDHDQPIVAAAHHAEWINLLEDRTGHPFICLVAPPGFAKSTWCSWAYPTWRLGVSEGRARVGIVSRAAGQASAWVQAVSESIEERRFIAAHPHAGCRPNKKRGWSRSQFYLKGTPSGNNPACIASGVGGVSVLGKRLDEIVLDDPTTWEDARSKTKLEGQKHFLRSTLISRFPPGMGPPEGKGGRMVVVLTRWSEQDLVPELQSLGFTIVRMPALGYHDRREMVDEETGEVTIEYGSASLWPERISEAQLLALQEEDPLVFELVYQGNAAILAGDFFDEEWFRHGPLPKRDEFERVVTFVDTASGKKRREGDFTVLLTLGRHKDGSYWVMDVVRDRFSTVAQPNEVKKAHDKWRPDLIAIEDKNEGVALFQRLAVEENLPIRPYNPVKDKEYRATPVAARYRAGGVFHEAYDRDGVTVSPRYVNSLEVEMKAFPESEHDDQVDALAGAFNCMQHTGPRLTVIGQGNTQKVLGGRQPAPRLLR